MGVVVKASALARRWLRVVVTGSLLLLGTAALRSQDSAPALGSNSNFGPYNATFLAGGIGLTQPLSTDAPLLPPAAAWSMSAWLRIERSTDTSMIVAAIGALPPDSCRCLLLDHGQLALRLSDSALVRGGRQLQPGDWHAVAVTYDGRNVRLYLDGEQQAQQAVSMQPAAPTLHLAPDSQDDLTGEHHFGGSLASFQLYASTLDATVIGALAAQRPDFALVAFEQVGVGWPWQQKAWRGLLVPQPAWTLPRGNAPYSAPVRAANLSSGAPLQANGDDHWLIGGWHMLPAPRVPGQPADIASAGFQESDWYVGLVPGTALTSLIANGVYPDPSYGLNNLAIPEALNRQDYWYRSEFQLPAGIGGRQLTLTFNGINYAAEVWFNGTRLGSIRGAFIRGTFDLTSLARPGGANVLAVRVSPPPHPGIPHEQSVAAGPGENGGNLAIDGPTFVATEGWDWIPAIRDRDTGIWQSVELTASGSVQLLDPQVITRLPLPRTDSAAISIRVPVDNRSAAPVHAAIDAAFEGVQVHKEADLAPGVTELQLDPAEFSQLRLAHPRLWWPNGYGSPELYHLTLTITVAGKTSDWRQLRFGIRELSYELSLFDHAGRLRRVEVDPTLGSERHERLIDVRHEAIKRTANGWAESLTTAGETSPAVRDVDSTALTPYLVIRVNGVAIAARGGSWGTDDLLKRSSREHLEPFFKLHQQAHLNIIRNWLGQNTEQVFYDLADEYGLLVLNDFWESTQDFQVEIEDPQLFLANARDVIRRFRNHPSIAVWFGRNEGVPQPILNEGLAALVAEFDGTRYYTGSSNRVNLQDSGPYNYRPPEGYFTQLAQGFAVEVGTPSFSSLEAIRASIPAADRWPLGDAYAYHDWHFGGNGDTATFMHTLQQSFGAGTDLEDFERKAQLMNYVTYRAIFEGFQAHLWTRNSGRLLWMTHPAWPSNEWQIYSSDYDTAAAYYAVANACEPLHVQLNLPDFSLAVINTTRLAQRGLQLRTRVVSLDNHLLLQRTDTVGAAANATTTLRPIDLAPLLAREGVVLVALTLTDVHGTVRSRNFYWQAREDANLRQLNQLPQQALTLTANARPSAEATVVDITVRNAGPVAALAAKLSVLDAHGARVLPAYYSDNYLSLLPGESRVLQVRCPNDGPACVAVAIRGWNVAPTRVAVQAHTP
ncbi:MAG TPA: LamG-like jellyroll fold domain-containing protein [Steroidobacteraceae bacterium]